MSGDYFKNLSDNTTKAILTGAIAGLASYLVYGEAGTVNVVGLGAPAYLAIGGAAALGSYTSDMYIDSAIQYLPQSQSFKNIESIATKVGLSGAATAIALKLLVNIPNENLFRAFVVGGGSKIVGDFTYDNLGKDKSLVVM